MSNVSVRHAFNFRVRSGMYYNVCFLLSTLPGVACCNIFVQCLLPSSLSDSDSDSLRRSFNCGGQQIEMDRLVRTEFWLLQHTSPLGRVVGSQFVCRWFGTSEGCLKGVGCKKLHICKTLGIHTLLVQRATDHAELPLKMCGRDNNVGVEGNSEPGSTNLRKFGLVHPPKFRAP